VSTVEKYEAISAGWVQALAIHVEQRWSQSHFFHESIWSHEFTDPPPHLLRQAGDGSIGFRFIIANGKLRVEDGVAHHGADIAMIVAYDPVAFAFRIPAHEYHQWLSAEAPKLRKENKLLIIGNNAYTRAAWGFLWEVRDSFYAQYTA
jgi:hypothetical protein